MVEHSPAGRRALIVEDETLFAMGLAVDMQALGFAHCDLAATGQDAFLKAMEDEPVQDREKGLPLLWSTV